MRNSFRAGSGFLCYNIFMKQIPVEEMIVKTLKKKKKTLALAESCTGGLISNRITDIPGSSKVFLGSVMAYSNQVKNEILGVDQTLIKNNGAVSSQVARAMAEGAKSLLCSDFAASVTGIAGPAGGSKEKPTGLAYIAFTGGEKTRTKKILFKGNRLENKKKFADAVLEMVLENIV